MSDIVAEFNHLISAENATVEDLDRLIYNVLNYDRVLSIPHKVLINLNTHMLALRIARKNDKGHIMQPFDALYSVFMGNYQRVKEDPDKVWLCVTPLIRELKQFAARCDIRTRLVYIILCNRLQYSTNMSLAGLNKLSYEEFMEHPMQITNALAYTVTPNVRQISHSAYTTGLQELAEIIPPCDVPRRLEKSCLLVTNVLDTKSSDWLAYGMFLEVLAELGYAIDAYVHTSTPGRPVCVRNVYVFSDVFDEPPGKYLYDIVLVATHNTPASAFVLARGIGKVYINLLGHVCAGCPAPAGALSYNVIPEWDNPKNYSGTAISLYGMACGLRCSTPMGEITSPELPHIVFPYTGAKFNNLSLKFIRDVRDYLGEAPYEASILLGNVENLDRLAPLLRLYFGTMGPRWNIIVGDPDGYWRAMQSATVVVGSYPYNGYATVLDALSCGKSVVGLYSEDCNGHQCAYRILQLQNLDEGYFDDKQHVLAEIKKYVTNGEYRRSKVEEYKNYMGRFGDFVVAHNEKIRREFHNKVQEVLRAVVS